MPTDTVSPPAPGPDQADPSGTAPPGMKWQVLFRALRSDPWRVLIETATGEQAWDAMCSGRASGEYRPQLVRADLFDESTPGKG